MAILVHRNTAVTEWNFECDYDGTRSGFDGVTLAVFDGDGRIANLKEFESKAQHCHPYEA